MSSILGLEPLPGRQSWEKSLGEFLEIVTAAYPDKTFVEIAGQEITYRQLMGRCRKAAGMFRSLGIGHGDRVCLFLPNVPEVLYTWFGLSLIGGIAVTINTAYRRDEMAYILNNAEAAALVAHDRPGRHRDPGRRRRRLRAASPGLVGGMWSKTDGRTTASCWTARPRLMSELPARRAHRHLNAAIYLRHHRQPQGRPGYPSDVRVRRPGLSPCGPRPPPDDRFFTCLPYFHANAQYYSTMGTLWPPAPLSSCRDRFSASRFWQQVRDARATVVNFIGMMMPVLAKNDPQPDDARQHRPPLLRLAGLLSGVPDRLRSSASAPTSSSASA